ncbi:MAG: TlpA family protein disulfide reductase, partial [Prevotella sp.]|nr:TlpA family protein disulfide reductase [Prevotella sp.]
MKKIFLTLILMAATLFSWAAETGKLHVNTELYQFGDSIYVICGGKEKVFSGKDGRFSFDLDVAAVTQVIFTEPRAMRGDMENLAVYRAPAVPGDTLFLVCSQQDKEAHHYYIKGSGFYAAYYKADFDLDKATEEESAIMAKFTEMQKNNAPMDQLMKVFTEETKPAMERAMKKTLDYIKQHPAEESSVALIGRLESLDMAKEALDALTPEVRDGRMKPYWQSFVTSLEKQAKAEEKEREAAKKQAEGLLAPDFTLNDQNGKPFKFSSLRGKYVVIDFWGSWCIWCIKGFPKMKEYYQKYPGKFEILGVDCNDTEEKWKTAIKKHELPWLHVYAPNGSSVFGDYGIMGFPTKIIVGPDGKIIKTIV